MFMAFLDLLALIVSLAVSLAIVVPLSGILIRYRCVRGGNSGAYQGLTDSQGELQFQGAELGL